MTTFLIIYITNYNWLILIKNYSHIDLLDIEPLFSFIFQQKYPNKKSSVLQHELNGYKSNE